MNTEQYTQHIQTASDARLAAYADRDIDADKPLVDLLQRLAIAELERRKAA